MDELLKIKNLHVTFQSSSKVNFHAIKGIDITIGKNETVGIVGESGSGKSVTATSVMGLLPKRTIVTAEEMSFEGKDLLGFTQKNSRKSVEMISQ
ncbi:ATP-binding cassette domain-containing protein [Jeotgalibaca sp. MA1X17-3]|uniref:ATP-binding cassette domain-containing protein n=1 Tax=Jeotgalibaca sp. MA1X17-3 TaxID=2908211 RepID=UPI001F4575D0|nr:ATP-binding cassette domain-containing protein [Jeotgalibaca sp. MA1X17-3]UJF15375.1 ATP-binding cassette domain-containing protein [Jeotgalibaca sp. MA1X17-3]